VLALASLAALRRAERQAARIDPADPHSPWLLGNGWRLGPFAGRSLQLQANDTFHTIRVQYREDGYDLTIAGRSKPVSGTLSGDDALTARIGEVQTGARAIFDGGAMTLFSDGEEYSFVIVDPYRPAARRSADAGHLLSPMPGVVVSVAAEAGQKVSKGTVLVVVEAMKMEHAIAAPRDGLVKALNVAAGDRVAAGEELVVLEAIA
jgi:3-methylcrotonyl-CoA carboxylase alpha subunit